jgi:two-component system C4-dicarboxylate transport sensor histidine kinase DctB
LAGTVWFTNTLLTDRFTETTRNRPSCAWPAIPGPSCRNCSAIRWCRSCSARDPVLIRSLESNDYTNTSQRLISYVEEIGAASLILLDRGPHRGGHRPAAPGRTARQ